MPDIRTLGDVLDPLRLEEVWLRDSYEAAPWIKPGSVVVDIGAGVGEFAIWAAQRGAQVIAVEPEPANVRQLRVNARRMGVEVDIREAAVGPADGFCAVHHGPGDWSLGGYTEPSAGTTPMFCLDTLLASLPVVDVLKVDVEGAEYEAFAAASGDTLARVRYLAIEVHLWTLPGQPEEIGIGVRGGESCPPDAIASLIRCLKRTHRCDLRGTLTAGGYLFAMREAA